MNTKEKVDFMFPFAAYICYTYRHPDIILSYLQFSLFRDNRKKLNYKKNSNISALS